MSNCIECTDIYPQNICEPFDLGSIAGGVQDVTVQFESVADGSVYSTEVETGMYGDITVDDIEANILPNVKYMITINGGDVFTLTDGTTVTSCVRVHFRHVKTWN
jgi:hypothetical protein